MALPTPDTQAKVASEAAQIFIDRFYEALTHQRPLSPFYASTSPKLTGAGIKPDLSINGQPLDGGVAAYEALLKAQAQGNAVAWDVSSFDAQPVTAWYRIGDPSVDPQTGDLVPDGGGGGGGGSAAAAAAAAMLRNGDKISFAVQVNGTVRYGRGHVADAGGSGSGSGSGGTGGTGGAANGGADGDGDGGSDGARKSEFSESFLLVPHWEASGRNAAKGMRKWVIVSQNFRAL
ncbi:hypothetical protein GGR54DRAFT_255213 [Hypoxylon sp. NC1633]|nr:hypothetical protein GGR54DRAFT_255213 [Hypoxylon sp. NC1633]